MNNQSEIYLAGGCFWGTEHFIKLIDGIEQTVVGYANSNIPQPTYEQVCTGTTHAAETVKVVYNSESSDLLTLLDLFFKTIDPTILDRQGNDIGSQYRTGIYYTQPADRPIIDEALKKLATNYESPIVVEVKPLENFYAAELYHQDYLDKNPNGYCHIHPALFNLAKKSNIKKQ